jgi:TetR/AcrR family transcriptional regulator, tetracycline repressor protein
MATPDPVRRRRLTRRAIVERALELGDAEGLEAVSLRRLASDFAVTPMALYRHVHDKQDLINAMTDAVMEDFDLKAGVRPSMPWTEQVRRAMLNFKEQMDARRLALPLSIAYTGEGPAGFWRMTDDLLGILLQAGFARRQAIVLIRVVSSLLSGYLLLLRQNDPVLSGEVSPSEMAALRKRVELFQLSLPPDRFPNIVKSAGDVADVWFQHPDRWWRQTVDLLVYGLEQMLASSRSRRGKGAPKGRGGQR